MRFFTGMLWGLAWLASSSGFARTEEPAPFSEETWLRFLDESVIPDDNVEFEGVLGLSSESSMRVLVKQIEAQSTVFLLKANGIPEVMVSGKTGCYVNQKPAICRNPVRVTLTSSLDGRAYFGVTKVSEGEDATSRIHFPVGAESQIIREKNSNCPPQYTSALRRIRLDRDPHREIIEAGPNFRSAFLQLKTPTDAERFGHHLQSYTILSDDAFAAFEVRSVCCNPSYFCIQPHTPADLQKWVKRKDAAGDQPGHYLWHWAYRHRASADVAKLYAASTEFTTLGQRAIQECGPRATLSLDETKQLVEEMIVQLRLIQKAASPAEHRDQYGAVDDPNLLFRFAEGGLGAYGLTTFMYQALGTAVLTPDMPLELRAACCDVVGDIGRPPLLNFEFIETLPDAKFMEAILFSRWEWDWTAEHSAACLKVLASEPPKSRASYAAVESLVRMDELPRVPQEHLLAWYAHDVCHVDADKHATLGFLSRQPTGRAFLRTRIGSKDSLVVQEPIRRKLWNRAESTLRTKRFDFMTEAECRLILDDPKLILSTRDTASGPARPFPAGE